MPGYVLVGCLVFPRAKLVEPYTVRLRRIALLALITLCCMACILDEAHFVCFVVIGLELTLPLSRNGIGGRGRMRSQSGGLEII